MKKVKSSTIETIRYDPSDKRLEIVFKNGGEYHYQGVTQKEYDDLESAESVGSHFAKWVRPHHKGEKK